MRNSLKRGAPGFSVPGSGGAGSLQSCPTRRDGKGGRTPRTEAVGCIMGGSQEAKTEILDDPPARSAPRSFGWRAEQALWISER